MITLEEIARLRELTVRIPLPLDAHKDAGQYRAISISEFSPNGGRWIVGDIMDKYADDIVAAANELPALLDEIERLKNELDGMTETARARGIALDHGDEIRKAALKRAEAAEARKALADALYEAVEAQYYSSGEEDWSDIEPAMKAYGTALSGGEG